MPEALSEKFEAAFAQLSHPHFLEMKAIGGEVPFYVFSYPAEQENEAQENTEALAHRMKAVGHPVCIIDLLKLSLDILREHVDLEDLYELEQDEGPEELLETLHSLLDMEERFVPALTKVRCAREEAEGPHKVLFLVGVGRVFPFLRSHTLLNNLQRVLKDRPTVLFFPGQYSGTALKLFGKLDNNYYRAFHLDTLNLST